MIRYLLTFLLLIVTGLEAHAEGPWDSLARGPETQVIDVIDGDTVVISPEINGAGEIRLVGIQAPKIPLGRPGFKTWPYGELAKSVLEDILLKRTVTLYFGDNRMDRHGRLLAHLKRDDGLWVQGDLLDRGMARVYSFPDNRTAVDRMLIIERTARGANRGIWKHPFYALRTPEEAAELIGRFELVEGVVKAVTEVGKTIYINFGEDWRSDFTLTIKGKARRLFRDSSLDILSLTGRTVRTRGWLKSFNGPMVNLTHPEQMEVLD